MNLGGPNRSAKANASSRLRVGASQHVLFALSLYKRKQVHACLGASIHLVNQGSTLCPMIWARDL